MRDKESKKRLMERMSKNREKDEGKQRDRAGENRKREETNEREREKKERIRSVYIKDKVRQKRKANSGTNLGYIHKKTHVIQI